MKIVVVLTLLFAGALAQSNVAKDFLKQINCTELALLTTSGDLFSRLATIQKDLDKITGNYLFRQGILFFIIF